MEDVVDVRLPALEERILARTEQVLEDKGVAANHCTLQQMGQMLQTEREQTAAMLTTLTSRLPRAGDYCRWRYNTRKQKGWSTHLKDVQKWPQQGGYGGRGALAKHVLEVGWTLTMVIRLKLNKITKACA